MLVSFSRKFLISSLESSIREDWPGDSLFSSSTTRLEMSGAPISKLLDWICLADLTGLCAGSVSPSLFKQSDLSTDRCRPVSMLGVTFGLHIFCFSAL